MKSPAKRLKPRYYNLIEHGVNNIFRLDSPDKIIRWFDDRTKTWINSLTDFKMKDVIRLGYKIKEVPQSKMLVKYGRQTL